MSQFDPSLPANIPPGAPTTPTIELNYNQTGFDVQHNNYDSILMASTSLSASTAIAVTNFNGRGAYFFMNITSAFPGSASTTYALKIKAVQPNAALSAQTIVACVPRSASGCTVLCVYPGVSLASGSNSVSAVANLAAASLALPRNFQVVASLSSGATSKEVVMSLGMTILI